MVVVTVEGVVGVVSTVEAAVAVVASMAAVTEEGSTAEEAPMVATAAATLADAEVTTAVAVPMEACEAVHRMAAVRPHLGLGLGKATPPPATPRRAGIPSEDQAVVMAQPEERATAQPWLATGPWVDDLAVEALGQPTRQSPTGSGIRLVVPAGQDWVRMRDRRRVARSTTLARG